MPMESMPEPANQQESGVDFLRMHAREIIDLLTEDEVLEIVGSTKEQIAEDMLHPEDVHRVNRKLLENAEAVRRVRPEFDTEMLDRELVKVGSVEQCLSQFLGLKEEEVTVQMETLHGINDLYEQLRSKRSEVQKIDPNFNITELEEGLQLALDVIQSKEALVKDASSPEKAGMFRKAFESLKSFPKNHPIVTALLVAALAAGGIAAGFYFTGNWELLLSSLGVAAKESARVVPGVLDGLNPYVPTPPPLSPAAPFSV